MPKAAKAYIDGVVTAGLAIAVYAMSHWDSQSPIRFFVFLALFVGAALLKGRIPGITGTYSPVFFFVLLGSHLLSFSEVVFAVGLAAIVQCTLFVKRHPSPVQVAFNAANLMISSASVYGLIHRQLPGLIEEPLAILLILGATVYYLVNTGLVAIVITLVDAKPLNDVWRHWCLRSLPFYLCGALIAGVSLNSQVPLSMWVVGMVCPSILLVTHYYRYWLESITRVNALALESPSN
jgi:hypothetical protein